MRYLILGDLHYGEQGDSEKHNQRTNDMLLWCVDRFKGKVDRVIQLGDWYHNRSKVNLQTLDYGIKGAKILSDSFGRDNVLVLVGNHDLYNKSTSDITSLRSIESYVTLVEKNTIIDGNMFAPWIITEDQWNEVVEAGAESPYLFAHLELSGFLMNDHYEMEHGFSHKELRDYTKVFTGHYHSHQERDNIIYTGIPFPVSMNEANRDTGVWILDTDSGDYEMVPYDKVKVLSVPYDQVEEAIEGADPEHTTIRVEFPDDLEDETLITEVSDILNEMNFSGVKVKYKGNKAKKLLDMEVDEIEEVENIDAAVLNFISTSKEVEGIDKTMLSSIYEEAKNMEDSQ